jgi:hypothetical protein
MFEAMVLLRAAVLLWILVLWIRGSAAPLEVERRAQAPPASTETATA